MGRQALTDTERAILEDVQRGPRPGGYKVDIATLIALQERGLVSVEAVLTEAGREALR